MGGGVGWGIGWLRMGQTRGMADALERITNLVALLLETRSPLTLEQIANELAGQYPAGEAALRGSFERAKACLLYTSPSPRDRTRYRMPSSACK